MLVVVQKGEPEIGEKSRCSKASQQPTQPTRGAESGIGEIRQTL